MEQYKVRQRDKEPLLRFICEALEGCGASILQRGDPSLAPFQLSIQTPQGEVVRLICYAFLANKYTQQSRPRDEHRFQVKYGSDFQRYHELFIAPEDDRVTLMFGVHLTDRVVVAVDPSMHAITWFSRSIEFKDSNISDVHQHGWFGWERDRKEARRKQEMPLVNYQTEALLGFRPEHFLRYVQFERLAKGMDPGERLLLIDRLQGDGHEKRLVDPHPLELELGLSARQILDMIDGAFRLKVAIRGSAAELHLEEHMRTLPNVTRVRPIDRDGRPDFEVEYRRRRPVLVECKNVLRRLSKNGPRVDFQKTRAAKGNPCSRYYRPDEFQILAACLHPVTESWDFRFRLTSTIDSHPRCDGHLTSKVELGGNGNLWTSDLPVLLEQLTR